jgi:hypothetical protein
LLFIFAANLALVTFVVNLCTNIFDKLDVLIKKITKLNVHMIRYCSFLWFLLALSATNLNAQRNAQSPNLEDMQRRMMELQKQLMQDMQRSPFFDFDMRSPFNRDSSSSFSFKFDTTFQLGDGGFFQFRHFGSDSLMQGMFQDMDQMFGRMFDFGDDPFRHPLDGGQPFPSDDGHGSKENDGLLPEERLRLEEESKKQFQKKDWTNFQIKRRKSRRYVSKKTCRSRRAA